MSLQAIEHETAIDPTWSVIWLHGLGADGSDFAPVVPQLVQRGWPALRFVFPHAPVRAVTINNGVQMRAWYDIVDTDLANRADETGVNESVALVEALLAAEVARGVPRGQIFLAGFSQGGAVTLAAGLRQREPLAGLIALSTYLPAANSALASLVPEATAQPVFMAHGRQDPVVPYTAGERSAAALRSMGFAVDWRAYAMPHTVCADEVDDLRRWMSKRFEAA
ncbi:MAG TPA: alpha/beta hydrolase [Luteimonas sp.]|nr:alpha/beta hydrolase [Luteimonas sp.]